MNKPDELEPEDDDLLPEYDLDALLQGAARGKYAKSQCQGADDDNRQDSRRARLEQARGELDGGNGYTAAQVEAILKADGLLP